MLPTNGSKFVNKCKVTKFRQIFLLFEDFVGELSFAVGLDYGVELAEQTRLFRKSAPGKIVFHQRVFNEIMQRLGLPGLGVGHKHPVSHYDLRRMVPAERPGFFSLPFVGEDIASEGKERPVVSQKSE